MKNSEFRIKLKVFFRILKRSIKVKNLLVLIIILSANTFAWFVYSKEVRGELEAHVRSWKVVLESNNTEVINYVDILIPEAYPGMPNFVKEITVYNQGESNAVFEYTLLSARLLNTTFESAEKLEMDGETLTGDEPTSADILDELENDYPFSISVTSTTGALTAEVGESLFSLTMSWPYESGNDELDTIWGTNAYNYLQSNPNSPCIALTIRLRITQATSTQEPEECDPNEEDCSETEPDSGTNQEP